MESFAWNDPCSVRPLSVALTLPCHRSWHDLCGQNNWACCESDFVCAYQPQQICEGRRFRRKCFSNYRPNAYYGPHCYLPGPLPSPSLVPWGWGSTYFPGNNYCEEIFDEWRCRPTQCVVQCVPCPRPSSCVGFRQIDRCHRRYDININHKHEIEKKPPTPPLPPPPPPRPPPVRGLNDPRKREDTPAAVNQQVPLATNGATSHRYESLSNDGRGHIFQQSEISIPVTRYTGESIADVGPENVSYAKITKPCPVHGHGETQRFFTQN